MNKEREAKRKKTGRAKERRLSEKIKNENRKEAREICTEKETRQKE